MLKFLIFNRFISSLKQLYTKFPPQEKKNKTEQTEHICCPLFYKGGISRIPLLAKLVHSSSEKWTIAAIKILFGLLVGKLRMDYNNYINFIVTFPVIYALIMMLIIFSFLFFPQILNFLHFSNPLRRTYYLIELAL